MAAARAGVLGVRWLQKAARNVVPLGARTGPLVRARPQCGWEGGVPEVYCVGRRVDLVGYHGRRVRGRAEVELAERKPQELTATFRKVPSWAAFFSPPSRVARVWCTCDVHVRSESQLPPVQHR